MSTFQEKRIKLEIFRTKDQLERHQECLQITGKTEEKGVLNKMKQNNDKLQKRGECLNELKKKTNQMAQSSSSYLNSCRQLRQKLTSSAIGVSSTEEREEKDGGIKNVL